MNTREDNRGHQFEEYFSAEDTKKLNKKQLKALKKGLSIAETIKMTARKTGRNQSCPCGSGRKFKKCCIAKANQGERRIA